MSLELGKKIINDLKDFQKPINVLQWHGWGEPLLNRNLPEMIRYAKDSNVALSVETTTNGILLTPELSDKLMDAGINRINISVQSITSEGYFKICGKKIDIEEYVSNIRYLYEHKNSDLILYIKIADVGLESPDEEQLFYNMFGDICDEIMIEKIVHVRDDAAANENIPQNDGKGVFGQEAYDRKVCPFLFYRLFICPDGVCALCNADWYRDFIVGNVTKQSIKEIWNGSVLREIQKTHLRGERHSLDLCAKCGNVKYNTIDNVDEYTAELFHKLETKE
jgi:MoaA/NifB/PqqE/SkfB family radical SAM enzyme